MVLAKESVRIKRFSPTLIHIWERLVRLNDALSMTNNGWPVDWTITSVNDGVHSDTSAHYRDEAIDLRVHNFTDAQKPELWRYLKSWLGDNFFVDLETPGTQNEHIHIQLRKGRTLK